MAEGKKEENDSNNNNNADKKGEGEAAAAVPVDPRVEWFGDKVCNALKLKSDKWKKLTSAPENW